MDSQSDALPRGVTPIPSTEGFYELELLPSQDDELFGCDPYYLTIVIGGPGSGKTTVNALHVIRWGDICTELPYALFANTWDQMTNAILAELYTTFAEMGWIEGRDYVMGKKVPKKWRREWRRKNIRVPVERASGVKMLVLRRTGVHIYLGTYANRSWTRIKGQSIMALIGEEITEPDVNVKDFLTYAITRVRCGHGANCAARGHFHRIILKGNVPLHNPNHEIYTLVEDLKAKESKRESAGQAPFFRLLEVDTRENIHLGSQYVPALEAAMDSDTFEEQVSGKLQRRRQGLIYYAFSEQNILPVAYDRRRPLHLWFDWNNVPATAGWGHDLRYDEVPRAFLSSHAGTWYFGVNGELHSGAYPMQTHQVAEALLEDPTRNADYQQARCADCSHPMSKHGEMPPRGWYCRACAFERPSREDKKAGVFCAGATLTYSQERSYLHAADGWRGLREHIGMIYVYGDATGKQSHADAIQTGGCIKIIRDYFDEALGDRVVYRFRAGNPPINIRCLAVNRSLEARNGVRSLYFAPHCTAHIDDCRQVIPDKDGKPLKKDRPSKPSSDTYWQRTHSMDGCGYMVDWRAPFDRPKSGLPFHADSGDFSQMGTVLPSP